MPVKPCVRIIDRGGWKHDENDRFGAVVVCVLETYAQDGKVKTFHFAPTLEDLPVLERCIEMVREVDKYNKAILSLKEEAESLEPRCGCYAK